MRIGLIGVGRIGARHARVLQALGAVDTVLLADAQPGRAQDVARTLQEQDPRGVDVFDGIEDLIANRPDGLVITAPTPAHAEIVGLAAAAKVPIFCEKPLASDIAGTRRVLDEVERAKVPLQMGFQRRFDPAYRDVRDQFQGGALGRLQSVWACTLDPEPPHPSYLPTSGGLYRDCSVHDIDAIRWSTGKEIVEVYATGSNNGAEFFRAAGDIDTAHAILTLDDGTLATMVASRYNGGGYEGRLELHGSLKTACAGLEGVQQIAYEGFADRFADAYVAELQAFTDFIAGKIAHSPCSGWDALEAFLVAEACELSRREHRPVLVNEVRKS